MSEDTIREALLMGRRFIELAEEDLGRDCSQSLAQIDAALASHETSGEEGWRPIETAPKKTMVLLAFPHHPTTVGRYEYGRWVYAFAITEGGDTPTHWRPLPAPPALSSVPARVGENLRCPPLRSGKSDQPEQQAAMGDKE